ncbi:MAG: Bacterial pre-peptidase C-terminal domain [Rhodobacteraceae bacterium HLUCCA12]|nr:MAG: Bacterial pre-peptidase C-terminal domain [Rhodobacteraceae bacterium HLUCCA12]
MNMFLNLARAAVLAVPFAATVAEAQNYNLRPSYGAVSLQAGFLPDPHTRRIQAGGNNRFTGGGGCPGGAYFANAPDYRVHYSAGGYSLTFYVRAPGDTALLVNDPSGTWYCNDDYQGLDPALVFNNPSSGQYDVWLGTYNRSRVRNSVLYVTEMGAFSR